MPRQISEDDVKKYHELALQMQLNRSLEIKNDDEKIKEIEERRKRIARRCDVKKITADIPFAMEIASLEGNTKVKIVSLGIDDYTNPERLYHTGKFNINWLRGVAKSVYYYCVKCKLNPTIEEFSVDDHGSYLKRHDIYIQW